MSVRDSGISKEIPLAHGGAETQRQLEQERGDALLAAQAPEHGHVQHSARVLVGELLAQVLAEGGVGAEQRLERARRQSPKLRRGRRAQCRCR